MIKVSIIGSTGSIGRQALNIIRMHRHRFDVVALSAGSNAALLQEQMEEFHPQYAVLNDAGPSFGITPPDGTTLFFGQEALEYDCLYQNVDVALIAVIGMLGIKPLLGALKGSRRVALVNKESLVCGGDLIKEAAAQSGCRIFPVDSEHSAVFQCLQGVQEGELDTILLTGSGGPFRQYTAEQLENDVTLEAALKHPCWCMGKKITIDSATLMNKGLEVIEASRLFDVSHRRIKVLTHPQSIVHSMITLKDGAVLAQMGVPDMHIPIQYALFGGQRMETEVPVPDFAAIAALTFETPDTERFPCLALAYQAAETGGLAPTALNAANEVAVELFLQEKIKFTAIARLVEKCLSRFGKGIVTIDSILDTYAQCRAYIMQDLL